MKREMDNLHFDKANLPMPEECYHALMDAACSVKEENKVKRASFRSILIAAILIIVTMAIAFAAQQLGWVDFYGRYGITLPKAAEETMNAAKPISYKVGPMTFTYNQLITDKRIVLSSAQVQLTDGTEALIANDSDLYEAVDAISNIILKKYGLKSGTTWVQAAQQLNLPLYGVRALVEVSPEYDKGEAMEDALWNEDGSIVYFNMPSINKDAVKDELPIALYMAVHQYDPATDEVKINAWTDREETILPVARLLAEKAYKPEGNATITLPGTKTTAQDSDGGESSETTSQPVTVTLTGIHAEQYATGIYLTSSFILPEGISEDAAREALYSLSFLGADGDELPMGINLSANVIVSDLPSASLESMTSLEILPDTLIILGGKAQVVMK